MSSRVDWYFRQRVTEAELDSGFGQLEQADRDLASDINVFGIISGAVAVQHQPVASLELDITGPTRAYDRLGRRVFVPVRTTVDVERDLSGMPTAVTTGGNERWLSVYMRFNRVLADPRIDGAGQQVFFRRDESFEFVVRQGPEGPQGEAPRPDLHPDELLVCDVRRTYGQTAILDEHIDVARRQEFAFARAERVAVAAGEWQVLDRQATDVQAALTSADDAMALHQSGEVLRHPARAIGLEPPWPLTAGNVQEGLAELIEVLAERAPTSAGSAMVGAHQVDGDWYSLREGTVDTQLAELNDNLNQHTQDLNAHDARNISATPNGWLNAGTVQGQLDAVITGLEAKTAALSGARRVGSEAVTGRGGGNSLTSGTVYDQLADLLGFGNLHANATTPVHPATAISLADANQNLIANDVEGAIAEILGSFGRGHHLGNEATPGAHRTIRQPAVGGTFAQLWEAEGTGGSRLRMYLQGETFWLTLNAQLQASGWQKDSQVAAQGITLTRNGFGLVWSGVDAPISFGEWPGAWWLNLDGTYGGNTWQVSGIGGETGRFAIGGRNQLSSVSNVGFLASVAFHTYCANVPTQVVFTTETVKGSFPSPPNFTVEALDHAGFFVTKKILANPGEDLWWYGDFTVVP